MSLVVLDTDVASTILRGRQTNRMQAKLAGKNWLITFVTLGELTQWTMARSRGPSKLARLASGTAKWWCCRPTRRSRPRGVPGRTG